MVLSLDTFSTELLLKIFKYLDIYDLCQLRRTCKRFNEIIEEWGQSLNNVFKPLVTNQQHPVIVDRSLRVLSLFERLRISRNWRLGIFKDKMLLYTHEKYMPWLQLEKDLLWISRGGQIQAYERNDKGINIKSVAHTIKRSTRRNTPEVCRFIKKGDLILSCYTNGSLALWSVKGQVFNFDIFNCHQADINSVDMCDEILVSGSRDNYVKIWQMTDKKPNLQEQIDMHDRVWSVALSEEKKSLLAIGTAGTAYMSTLSIFDINSQKLLVKFNSDMYGAGVLDIKWENPSVLWTCGYDSHLRRWDLRTGKCEQALADPCASTIYCFQYDNFNSIICGTQNNGRVVLWDTRQDDYIQFYFMECCRRGSSSPVYSLSYDPEFLFTVTDQYVNVLDFSVFRGRSRDYSNLFLKLIKV